ncbi:zinc finger protein ztf-16-like isoform X2 [Macrosteles quadrilineatus]|uniref:zinc finger protein ztf-16-like isoform X2 n=2 Tax=Macrosteles quadrilineatus TaxID=74068 RepID=UPI0023E339C3|nr:zinc finger protein ztf-16-like isoform X2 [Macrosteles quadrilineatus]
MAELGCVMENPHTADVEVDSMPLDNGANSNGEENGDGDGDGSLNTNYDSCDGTIPVHRCEKCENYETLSHGALMTHMSQCQGTADGDHRSRKMFECDVCNMKFSNGANMRRHKMRHTGVKPYECRVCQKRFFRKDHLAEHFTTHTKTLPYHCPICNRGFQRQIAMRAHFQNEHVGQHDMIKSCPLCSYRAGSMKSLRVHFFNRHGIDLDNPGPTPSANGGAVESSVNAGGCSDSGDSTGARSADNATPPMHFLTPHVEISMTDTPAAAPFSPTQAREETPSSCLSVIEPLVRLNGSAEGSTAGDCPGSPQSADSNSNAPSSSLRAEQEVTPSVSLIPIKQEMDEEKRNVSEPVRLHSATSSYTSTLIKVSPLKSLLRDDLKRRGTAITMGRARPEGPTSSGGDVNGASPDSNIWRSPTLGRNASLQCVFCGIGFPDQTLYFLHKGCHSDSNPWKCNICGEQCCNVYDFNSHLLSKTHQISLRPTPYHTHGQNVVPFKSYQVTSDSRLCDTVTHLGF